MPKKLTTTDIIDQLKAVARDAIGDIGDDNPIVRLIFVEIESISPKMGLEEAALHAVNGINDAMSYLEAAVAALEEVN